MKNCSILKIAFALVCFSSAIFANDEEWVVRGVIVDDDTRKPISGANIYIVDFPSLTANSNIDGFFQISIPEQGEYELGVFSFGYERFRPQSFKIGKNISPPTVTVRLRPTISKMPPIIITASREEKQAEVIKLTGTDLSTIAGTGGDPVRGLRYLPGVVAQYDYSAEPAIRGSTPDDNTYYIDFVPTPQLFHADGAVSVLPDELVSRFDLQSTAFAPGYDDVTGAVINVELRAPNKKKIVRQVDIKATQVGLFIEGPVSSNQSFFFSGRQSYLNLVVDEVSLDTNNVETKTPIFSDYFAKYLWEFSNTSELTFQLRGAKDEIEFEVLPGSDFALQQPALVGQSTIYTNTHSQALIWQYKPSKTITNKLAIGHYRTSLDSKYATAINEQETTNSSFVRNQLQISPVESHLTTVTWSAERKTVLIDSNALNANCTSFDIDCNISDANRASLSDTFELGSAAFALNHRWLVNNKTSATMGVRASEDNYLNVSFVEPRLTLKYKSSLKTEWSFGHGRHHQRPSLEFITPVFGNSNLRPIESLHTVVGVREFMAEHWVFQSEIYTKSFSNLIISDANENYLNGGAGNSRGIELLIRKRLAKKLSGWLSATVARTKLENQQSNQSFPFDYDQPITISLVLNQPLNKGWNVGLQWQYHSGQPFTPVVDTTLVNGVPVSVYGEKNSERLPDYHRLDVRMEYNNSGKKMQTTTFLEIINAYNRQNVAGYNYGKYFRKQSPLKQLPIFLSFGIKTTF